jgi:hypothetical protein
LQRESIINYKSSKENVIAIMVTKEKKNGEDKIVPFEMAQLDDNVFVSFEMTQLPNVLFTTGYRNVWWPSS